MPEARAVLSIFGPVISLKAERHAIAVARPIIEREALEKAAAWHDDRRRHTPDAFEMEFHGISAAAIRALGDDNVSNS